MPSCIGLSVGMASLSKVPLGTWSLGLGLELAVPPYQGVGRGVVIQRRLLCGLEFRRYLAGQRLSELDAPLVKRIDLPDRALGEHAVLVQRDQRAEQAWREPLGEQDVRRPVAWHDAVRHDGLCGALGADFRL